MMLVLRCKGFTAKEKRKILLFARTLFYLGRRKKYKIAKQGCSL